MTKMDEDFDDAKKLLNEAHDLLKAARLYLTSAYACLNEENPPVVAKIDAFLAKKITDEY